MKVKPSGPVWTLIAAYGLIGFGYVIPATFLPVIAGERLHLPALSEWCSGRSTAHQPSS